MNFTNNPVYKFILGTRQFGLEYTAKRWYSIYAGRVAELVNGLPGNVDGRCQGRVFVNVPDLGIGKRDPSRTRFISDDLPEPALPVSPYAGRDHGFYFPPEVDDTVWVSFDYGNIHQPKYLGSWWGNKGVGDSAPSTTELPDEFRSPSNAPPTCRGIKTGYGHGLLFSDEKLAPYVLLWSGKSTTLGRPADKYQKIKLSDDPSATGIYVNSNYGHAVELNDTKRTLTVRGQSSDPSGADANSVVIDDNTNTITIQNKGKDIITLDGKTAAITIDAPGPVNVIGAAGVNVTTPLAVSVTAGAAATIFATGGIAMGSGAAPPAPPIPGVAVETGVGAKIVTFAGAWTQTVGGPMSVTSAFMNLTAALLTLAGNVVITGNTILEGLTAVGPGTQQRLINQQIIDLLVNHKHPTAGLGPPSVSPDLAALGTSSSPVAAYVTQSLTSS